MTGRVLLAAAVVILMAACSATPDLMDRLDTFELNVSRYRDVAAEYLADPDWSKCDSEAEQLVTASNDLLTTIRFPWLSAPETASSGRGGEFPDAYRTAWSAFDVCLASDS